MNPVLTTFLYLHILKNLKVNPFFIFFLLNLILLKKYQLFTNLKNEKIIEH